MTDPTSRTVLLQSVSDRQARCQSCSSPIRWATTAKGKGIPLDARAQIEQRDDGPVVSSDDVHWATCPHAERHRKARTKPPAVSKPPSDSVYPPNRARRSRGSPYDGD